MPEGFTMSRRTIDLVLPDGTVQTVEPGTTPLDVAAGIGPGLAKAAIGAELDGRKVDLRQPLASGGDFRLFTARDAEAGEFVRHSAEHVLADAVQAALARGTRSTPAARTTPRSSSTTSASRAPSRPTTSRRSRRR